MEEAGQIKDYEKRQDGIISVDSAIIQGIIEDLRKQAGVLGAKISGSGLGDCVIGLGELPEEYKCFIDNQTLQRIPLQMTLQGVHCENLIS